MSIFAIIEDSKRVTVKAVHANLWCLPGVIGPTQFRLDVGVSFDSSDPLTSIDVALPFSVVRDARDLYPRTMTGEVASVLWGEPVNLRIDSGEGLIEFASRKNPEQLRALPIQRLEDVSPDHSDGITCWRLHFSKPTNASTTYVRARFTIEAKGPVWSWKRILGKSPGAVLDFRLNDVREAWGVAPSHGLLERCLPVNEYYLFVITPVSWRSHTASPDVEYTRVLEGEVWSKYLGRDRRKWFRRKRVTHYWRWRAKGAVDTPEAGVSTVHPARAFIDLTTVAPARATWPRLIAAGLLGALLFHWVVDNDDVAKWIENLPYGKVLGVVGVTTAGGIIAASDAARKHLRPLWRTARRVLMALDDAIFTRRF